MYIKKYISTVILSTCFASAATAQINLGILGDSIADDYLGPTFITGVNTNLAAGSFGQIMAETRGSDFNFGDYKSVEDGSWDQIRFSGWEHNWATAGAAASANTTLKLKFGENINEIPIASNFGLQVNGMSTMIAEGKIDTAVISIGANDFFYRSNIIDTGGGPLIPDPAGIIDQAFIDEIANSILDGIDVLQAAGDVDLLLGYVPVIPTMSQEEIDGVAAVNAILEVEAAAKGVVLFDTMAWTFTDPLVDPNTGDIYIGDIVIPYASRANADDISPEGDGVFCNAEGLCPLDSHAEGYLSEDGIHLNTIAQGLFANEIIRQLNSNFGYDVAEITDTELLALVGVNPVPVPAAAWFFASSLVGMFGVKRRRQLA